MATPVRSGRDHDSATADHRPALRLSTETKHATKTTEFAFMVIVVLGILISALVIKGGDTNGTDEFIARQAWLYVSIVAGSYFISRGLAKSGSRDPYWADGTNQQMHTNDR